MMGVLSTKNKVLACDVHVHLLQFCAIASFGLVGLCQVCGMFLLFFMFFLFYLFHLNKTSFKYIFAV